MAKPEVVTKPAATTSGESADSVSMPAADAKLLQEAAARSLELDAQVSELRKQLAEQTADRQRIDELTAQLTEARSRVTELSESQSRSNADAAEVSRLRRELDIQAEQNIALQEEAKQLRNQRMRLQDELDELLGKLREVSAGTSEISEPVPAGHARVVTLDVYVHEVSGRAPRSVPKGTVIVVSEAELTADALRRFPRLERYEVHRAKTQEKTRQELAPLEAGRASLEQVLQQAELTQATRQIEMRERSRAIIAAAADQL